MSLFSEANPEAGSLAPEHVAGPAGLSVIDNFKSAYNASVTGSAQFGIQEAMRAKDDQQMQAMRNAGVENIPSLSRQADDPFRMFTDLGSDYLDTAKFYEDGGDPNVAQHINDYDAKIAEVQKKYPGLNVQTSQQMWDSTKADAQQYEREQAQTNSGPVSAAAGFIGGTVGAFSPNANPMNVATLPLGGIAKAPLVRVGEQALVQGGVTGIEQLTGVQEQRKLLGLSNGPADALQRTVGAAIGGAAGQALGEVVGVGLRRVFRSTKAEPVPDVQIPEKPALPDTTNIPPGVVPADETTAAAVLTVAPQRWSDHMHEVAPTSSSPAGRLRSQLDLDHVTASLEDWSGPRPWETPPKQDTAPVQPASDFRATPDLDAVVQRANIDGMMRRIDPDTMAQFDALIEQKRVAQIQLAAATTDRDATVAAKQQSRINDLSDQISQLDAKIADVGAMKAKKLRGQKDELIAQRDAVLTETQKTDSPNMAVIRQRVMEADFKLRDLAPLVTRAKVRAQNRWAATSVDHDAVIQAIRDTRKTVPDTGSEVPTIARTLTDDVPMLRRAPEFEPKMAKNADAADYVQAILKDQEETKTTVNEAARSRLAAILKPEEDPLITVDGSSQKLHLDQERMDIAQSDGTVKNMSLREMLQEQLDHEDDLKAVSSCSIP